MKKLFLLLVSACAFIMNSCTQSGFKENAFIDSNRDSWIFYASFYEDDSRTILNEQMRNIWCADDRISIFMGNTYNHHYKFNGVTGDTNGSFSKVEDPFITGEILSANYALYPYSEDNSIDDNGIIHTSLLATQSYAENSFGLNSNTMVAVTENLESRFLAFQNICGYVRVLLYGENITLKEVSLYGNNEEILAGPTQILANYNQEPQITMDGATEKMLSIDCGEGINIGSTEYNATSFVFVVPPQTMEKGFTIVATDINGNSFTKMSNKSQEVKRNTILSMPTLKWVNDNAPKLEIPDGVLNIHNEDKGMLLVALMDYAYEDIVSMKVTGVMNDEDFLWIYYEMPALRYLDISDVNITTLPNRSFYQSSNVETIIMPKTLTTIPDEVFYESVIKDVYLNEGLQTIGESAFKNCDNITSIHIPQSVTTIGNNAFYDCNALKSVTFTENCKLSTLNTQVFYRTPIESIQIPANVETISTGDYSPFYFCTSLKTVTFEENSKLTSIGASFGYKQRTAIETIEIPNSVETIESRAFENTKTLKNLFFESKSSLQTIQKYAFKGCGIQTLQLPASTQQIYEGAFCNCSTLENVLFEENSCLKDIGIGIDKYATCYDSDSYGAFEDCVALKSITIPASVSTIYARAFWCCRALENVEFMDDCKLEIIDGGWFIRSGSGYLDTYSNGAFGKCFNLKSITIPKSVTTIGCGAFYNAGLTTVTFEENSQLEELPGYIYYQMVDSYGSIHCHYYEDSTGRPEAYSIGAFAKTEISSIILPASIKIIGDGVFASCKSLKKVTFEENSQLTSIGKKAFKDCDLSSITIPKDLEIIGESAFANNVNLKIINFEANSKLTNVDDRAFIKCGAINYVYAQNVTNLQRLGRRVFEDCDDVRLFKLGTVSCPTAYDAGSEESFGDIGIYSVLKVPTESVEAYKSATGWKNFASITGLDE